MNNLIKNNLSESLISIYYIDEAVKYCNMLNENNGPDFEWDLKNDKFNDYTDGVSKKLINNIDKSKEHVNNKAKALDYIKTLTDKVSSLPEKIKRKIVKYALISLIGFLGASALTVKPDYISGDEIKTMVKAETPKVEAPTSKFVDGETLSLSQNGWDFIKDEEKLKLKAYDIGDNMITVGWGHAERKNKTNIKVGDEITKEQAQKLIEKDMKVAADGIRRMFKQWKAGGSDVKVTQNMFDALVSLAFNSGVGGVRKSDFVKELKDGNYEKTAELIKTHKVIEGFKGLIKRRVKEANLFKK